MGFSNLIACIDIFLKNMNFVCLYQNFYLANKGKSESKEMNDKSKEALLEVSQLSRLIMERPLKLPPTVSAL